MMMQIVMLKWKISSLSMGTDAKQDMSSSDVHVMQYIYHNVGTFTFNG